MRILSALLLGSLLAPSAQGLLHLGNTLRHSGPHVHERATLGEDVGVYRSRSRRRQSNRLCATASAGTPSPPAAIDAKILAQNRLLVNVWSAVAFPDESVPEVEFKLSDYGLTRRDVAGFTQHFQTCKDCAADQAFLMATSQDGQDVLRLRTVSFPLLSEEDDDEWGGFDESLLGDDISADTPSIFPIEPEDSIVLADSKAWVRSVIADFGVCPFTLDPERAGIPQGGVRYTVSRAVNIDEAFLRYWDEIQTMLLANEKDIATVLLVFPELELFGDYELFEAFCECLSDSLCASGMGFESEVQLVFFHPRYQFRDGQARTGEEMGAANFARRSPWPMINLLRTKQVRAAQKGIPTGIVYKQNEERLCKVGVSTLTNMLYSRDWTGLPVHSASKLMRQTATGVELVYGDGVVQGEGAKCPVDHSQMMQGVSGKPVSSETAASIENEAVSIEDAVSVSKVEPSIETVSIEPVSSESVSNIEELVGAEGIEDYARFAEEVERWMELQEASDDL